jgi:uncharacterized protein
MSSGKKSLSVAGLAALFFIASVSTAYTAEVAVPPLRSHVTDLTHTLSAVDNARLEQKLAAFEARKGSQIAVLIVPTTQPETIEQYSIRVTDAWKLGRKGVDDGILLIIAKRDRAVRIEVGYGLEGILPDALAKRIVDQVIVPRFRKQDFAGGIEAGIESIMAAVQGEPLPPSQPARGSSASADRGGGMSPDLIFPLFIALLVFGKLLQSLLGRVAGASLMSVGAGFIGWLIFSSIILGVILAAAVFFLSLFGSVGPGIYTGRGGGWPGAGGMGGRGGFGGGGGGFSGGGGGFGGGGASGRW